eukprot:10726879-Alexandrium_andersonii.AAC.1
MGARGGPGGRRQRCHLFRGPSGGVPRDEPIGALSIFVDGFARGPGAGQEEVMDIFGCAVLGTSVSDTLQCAL